MTIERFYIKSSANSFTITHGLTHCFIETVESEKELRERIRYWVGLSEEELWMFLLYNRYVTIPAKNQLDRKSKFEQDQDGWYNGAWKTFTQKFYKKNPKLLVMDETFPYAVIDRIRMDKYANDTRAHKAEEERRKQMASTFKETPEDSKKEETKVGRLGSAGSLEKLRKRLKLKKREQVTKVETHHGITVTLIED